MGGSGGSCGAVEMIIVWPEDTPREAITPPYKRDLETGGFIKRYRTVDQLKRSLEIIAKAKGVKVPWDNQT